MGAIWSRHHSRSAPRRSSWTETIFLDSFEAEAALCNERAAFIKRHDIMALIPETIKALIISMESAHIRGFRELFVYLNNQRATKKLRRLVVAYFRESPVLSGHLSE
jgi:hypothetical protein